MRLYLRLEQKLYIFIACLLVVLMLILLVLDSLSLSPTHTPSQWSQNKSEKWSKLLFLTNVQDRDFFPKDWREHGPKTHAENTANSEVNRIGGLIMQELDKYPLQVLNRHVHAIAICSFLSVKGVPRHSASVDGRIYLSIVNQGGRLSVLEVRKLIHREISLLLLRDGVFALSAWRQLYSESNGVSISNKNDSPDYSLKQGFLSPQSRVSLEHDFSAFAEMLFVQPKTLKRLSHSYPRLRQKYIFIHRHYRSLAPDFIWPTIPRTRT